MQQMVRGLTVLIVFVGVASLAQAGRWVVHGYGGPVLVGPVYPAPVPVGVVYPVYPAPVVAPVYYAPAVVPAPVIVDPVVYPVPAYAYPGVVYPAKTKVHYGPWGVRVRVRY